MYPPVARAQKCYEHNHFVNKTFTILCCRRVSPKLLQGAEAQHPAFLSENEKEDAIDRQDSSHLAISMAGGTENTLEPFYFIRRGSAEAPRCERSCRKGEMRRKAWEVGQKSWSNSYFLMGPPMKRRPFPSKTEGVSI